MYLKKKLLNYIIRKLKKTFRLYDSKINYAFEKRLSYYVIQKLITNLKKIFADYVIQNITEK